MGDDPTPKSGGRRTVSVRALTKLVEKNLRSRQDRDSLKKQVDDLTKQLAEAGKRPTPEALTQEVETLRGQVRTSSHRESFRKLLGDKALGVRPDVDVDAFWRATGYKAEGDAVDEAKAREFITAAKVSSPFLFGEAAAGDKAASTTPPAGAGKGGRAETAVGPDAVRRSQLRDPVWMLQPGNQARAAEAIKAGKVVD